VDASRERIGFVLCLDEGAGVISAFSGRRRAVFGVRRGLWLGIGIGLRFRSQFRMMYRFAFSGRAGPSCGRYDLITPSSQRRGIYAHICDGDCLGGFGRRISLIIFGRGTAGRAAERHNNGGETEQFAR